jgi:hypothetical protein
MLSMQYVFCELLLFFVMSMYLITGVTEILPLSKLCIKNKKREDVSF